MFSGLILLLAVFFLGIGIGNRFTIYAFNYWLRELDRETQIQKLKKLTGYKNE